MTSRSPIILAAPHRALFASGALQALLSMAWWLHDLAVRYGGVSPWLTFETALPPGWWHAGWLVFGVFASFIFGFILTAGPRWQRRPDTPPAVYRPVVLLMGSGWLIADLGLVTPVLAPIGLIIALAGWSRASGYLFGLFMSSVGDRMHIGFMALAQIAGGVGLLLFAAATAGGSAWMGQLAIFLGLWCYLLPVFMIVVHRMLPFFSQSAIPGFNAARPTWTLLAMLAGSVGHGLLTFLEMPDWTWLADIPAAVAALRLTLLWRFRESFAATILAVLHVAFAWVSIGFALLGANSLLMLGGWPGRTLAPLHALTIGFASSMLIGMASRVTLGHSGRPIVGDRVMWVCFWAMQATAVVRVAGDFVRLLNPAAAASWLAVLVFWTVRYAPAWWRPREDGEPG
jgi:uncharacterized protein involved in response to NO